MQQLILAWQRLNEDSDCQLWKNNMKAIISALVILLVLLQVKLWFGEGSVMDVWQLEDAIAKQQTTNEQLKERNQALIAEVNDLKQGLEAIEERARSELGMIKKGETFYQVVE